MLNRIYAAIDSTEARLSKRTANLIAVGIVVLAIGASVLLVVVIG
jgi:hypothetical protein